MVSVLQKLLESMELGDVKREPLFFISFLVPTNIFKVLVIHYTLC